MSTSWSLRATACALLVSLVPGCSAVFMTTLGEQEAPYTEAPRCTSAKVAPVLDTIVTTGAVLMALAGLVAMTSGSDSDQELTQMVTAAGATEALGFGLSAHHGYVESRRCRRAQAEAASPGAAVVYVP